MTTASSVAQNEMELNNHHNGGLDAEVDAVDESHVASTEDSSSSSTASSSSSSGSGSGSSSSEEASSDKTSDDVEDKVEVAKKPVQENNEGKVKNGGGGGDGGFTKDGEFDYKPRKVREKRKINKLSSFSLRGKDIYRGKFTCLFAWKSG